MWGDRQLVFWKKGKKIIITWLNEKMIILIKWLEWISINSQFWRHFWYNEENISIIPYTFFLFLFFQWNYLFIYYYFILFYLFIFFNGALDQALNCLGLEVGLCPPLLSICTALTKPEFPFTFNFNIQLASWAHIIIR